MLKTVRISANSKTGPIAVTYRSGEHETYGTCPTSCSLHPKSETGTSQIDSDYLQAVFDSVPRGGQAWTYSHFAAEALPLPQPNKTVINASCDTTAEAVRAVELGRPAVYAAPLESADQWPRKSTAYNLPVVPQNWPTISAANSAAAAGHCAHVVCVILSLYLLRMAPEKRKLEKMKKAAATLQAARRLFNGTTREKTARLMMRQRFANLCGLSRMDLFCATISRAIAA